MGTFETMKLLNSRIPGLAVVLILCCLLAGCITAKVDRVQSGVIRRVSGGIAMVGYTNDVSGAIVTNYTRTALFVFGTSIGNFAFTSDDSRKPEQIVHDFSRVIDGLTNNALNGRVLIQIWHNAYRNWTVYDTEQTVTFDFSKRRSAFWIRKILQFPPNFIPDFTNNVDLNFVFQETTKRSLDTAARGP